MMTYKGIYKWGERYLQLAEHVASWSKDPSTKTGAVIVRTDKSIASVGFNGFPMGMKDSEDDLMSRVRKLDKIMHCEINALMFLRERAAGYTLYTWPFISCHRCAVQVIQAGIRIVVAPQPSAYHLERWGDSFKLSREFFHEAGVTVWEFEPT